MNPCLPASVLRDAPWRAPEPPPSGCGLALHASPQTGEAAALLREAWHPVAFLGNPQGVALVFDRAPGTPWCSLLAPRGSDDGMLELWSRALFTVGPQGTTALLSLPRGDALACIAHPDGWALIPIPLQTTGTPDAEAWAWIARQHPRVGTHPGQHPPIWGQIDTHPDRPNQPGPLLELAVAALEYLDVYPIPQAFTLRMARAAGWDKVTPATVLPGGRHATDPQGLAQERWTAWVVETLLGEDTARIVRQQPGRGGVSRVRMRLSVAPYVASSSHARMERRARWGPRLEELHAAWDSHNPDMPLR